MEEAVRFALDFDNDVSCGICRGHSLILHTVHDVLQ